MADPITVGGGGGVLKRLANYPIDLNFDDRDMHAGRPWKPY